MIGRKLHRSMLLIRAVGFVIGRGHKVTEVQSR